MSFLIDPYRFNSCPADALAFIAAAGITNATQKQAICTLVSDLQIYGIWTKMRAIYPFVGGTASTHKFNLKDPQDTNAAFRLVFNGGWTHSSNGAKPNGTNAFANTYLSPSGFLSLNNTSISYYSRENLDFTGSPIAAFSTGNGLLILSPRTDTGVQTDNSGVNNTTSGTGAATRRDGLFTASRIISTAFKVYRNAVVYRNSTITSTSLSTVNLYVGARNNNNSAIQYSALQCAFASIGDGLTDTEASNLYTAVQAYQTTLGRQV
jgi:hypothetical protein